MKLFIENLSIRLKYKLVGKIKFNKLVKVLNKFSIKKLKVLNSPLVKYKLAKDV
jgi:hypothetical protein